MISLFRHYSGNTASTLRNASFLWVNLTRDARTVLDQSAGGALDVCRVRKQGASFGQHLLRYRLARACERLADPGALAKEVAYAVGFNDLS